MTSGGHLITYDTLHLMEQIRAYDALVDNNDIHQRFYVTNETYTVARQLIRMMLAMPDLVHTRGTSICSHNMFAFYKLTYA
jgi:hypothetical protein